MSYVAKGRIHLGFVLFLTLVAADLAVGEHRKCETGLLYQEFVSRKQNESEPGFKSNAKNAADAKKLRFIFGEDYQGIW